MRESERAGRRGGRGQRGYHLSAGEGSRSGVELAIGSYDSTQIMIDIYIYTNMYIIMPLTLLSNASEYIINN